MPPKLNQGDRYEFVGETVGNDPGRISTGTIMTIREVVSADETGAYDDSADAVVLEWNAPTLGTDDDGEPTIVLAPRAWSVGVAEFPELFKRVKE